MISVKFSLKGSLHTSGRSCSILPQLSLLLLELPSLGVRFAGLGGLELPIPAGVPVKSNADVDDISPEDVWKCSRPTRGVSGCSICIYNAFMRVGWPSRVLRRPQDWQSVVVDEEVAQLPNYVTLLSWKQPVLRYVTRT